MWWLFLVTGIAWTLIAFAVLASDANTPALIGWLAGFVLLLAGINELVAIPFTAELAVVARGARCPVPHHRRDGPGRAPADLRHPRLAGRLVPDAERHRRHRRQHRRSAPLATVGPPARLRHHRDGHRRVGDRVSGPIGLVADPVGRPGRPRSWDHRDRPRLPTPLRPLRVRIEPASTPTDRARTGP